MSTKIKFSFTGIITILTGFVILASGVLLAINTWNTEITDMNPWFFSPIGLILALFGLLLMISRDE